MDEQNIAICEPAVSQVSEKQDEYHPENAQPEKVFTQKELDDIIKQRLERAAKNMPSKDELEDFRAWRSGKESGGVLGSDTLADIKTAREAAELRASEFEAKYTALALGAKSNAADDVIALAKIRISEGVSLEQAISAVIEKYPSFTASARTGEKPRTSGVHTSNNSGFAVDEAAARRAMGL